MPKGRSAGCPPPNWLSLAEDPAPATQLLIPPSSKATQPGGSASKRTTGYVLANDACLTLIFFFMNPAARAGALAASG
jgi:hypothetical protein